MQVAVIGARGRMGTTTCAAIDAAPDLTLVHALDVDDDLESVAGAQVAVIFTTPDAALDAVRACLRHNVAAVVGTTGLDDAGMAALEALCKQFPGTPVLVVPNFAIGAVLMMQFAAQAAPFFASVEVIEEHHPDKVDAPSGTAVRTAQLVAEARRRRSMDAQPDATTTQLPGARGCDVEGVPVHSVRLRGRLAHQSVLFGNPGETLTIRHDSSDRTAFMPGVLVAVRAIGGLDGLHIGLETVLDMAD